MTLEPRHPPTVPSYGTGSLSDLSASILASLDPELCPEQNVLGLAPAQRALGLMKWITQNTPAAARADQVYSRMCRPSRRLSRRRPRLPVHPHDVFA